MRTVLFIMKSISHTLSGFIQYIIMFLEHSFRFKDALVLNQKSKIMLKIDTSDSDTINAKSWRDNDEVIIGIGARPDRIGDFDQFIELGCLESLIPLIKSIINEQFKETIFVFYWISKVSSREDRFFILSSVFNQIKILSNTLTVKIVIVDNRQLLGQKNSALLERHFPYSCD